MNAPSEPGETRDPGEASPEPAEEELTERALDRAREEERSVPVIVKRTDEVRRHPDDILSHAADEGLEQLNRPPMSSLLSAVTAGLILGFSVMIVAVMRDVVSDGPASFTRLMQALVYPMGFIICIMSGTELFTEHTATAVFPVLERRASIKRLLRLWGVLLAGNLIGAIGAGALLAAADSVVQVGPMYVELGEELLHPGSGALFVSAVLAGWLMALAAWLVAATPPGITQMVAIFIVTFVIGAGGLHHSIAGAAELSAARFAGGGIVWTDLLRFEALGASGNLVGGSVFVALLNYGHIRQSRRLHSQDQK